MTQGIIVACSSLFSEWDIVEPAWGLRETDHSLHTKLRETGTVVKRLRQKKTLEGLTGNPALHNPGA
ncbi:hypothetical protein GCM10023212_00710 [Luteolibacter yonseiensis]